ncbi:phosphoesterase family-domain-containing protein [Corynascus novoguineensis]|uniref:Phosphoesterase family-domain-containing protein n=1 Tax=Corynascus novoguineensis TaxID=1126955 RepID=A0AAN7CRF8_9PEZI|nr:phosphoesterase family-domain-containing protein [Corynascus novoguineensis]
MKRFLVSLLGWVWIGVALSAPVTQGRAFDRFITIWLENQDYAKVVVDNSIVDLKRKGILLTKYYAHTHPSQPNYLAAIAGDYFGLDHDDWVRLPGSVATVVDLLEDKNLTWAGYFEDIPSPGYMGNASDGSTGTDGWDYVRKHNPFVTFDSVTNNGERLLNVDSFKAFQRAFDAKEVPQYVFMSPNMMNDGHNTTLDFATKWSHKFLQPLLADKAFDERTLIALTYDESEDYTEPNHIVTLLLGSAIPPALKGTKDDTFYTHYSMLSTIQANWGLYHLGRYDVGANVFKFVADKLGYTANKDPENFATLNNSASYAGILNEDPSTRLPIPLPNPKLIGASGLRILPAIEKALSGEEIAETPYDGSGKVFDGDKNKPVYKPLPSDNPS